MERFIKLTVNTTLFISEYFFKVSAGVTGLIVLGTSGTFFTKLMTGYSSLLPVMNQIIEFPQRVADTTELFNDYNTMTAAAFNQRYGAQALNNVMESLNESVAYFQAVYHNFAVQPFGTTLAFLIAFSSLYIIGRAICFIRQKGQGSYLTRMERQLGDRIFYHKKKHSHS